MGTFMTTYFCAANTVSLKTFFCLFSNQQHKNIGVNLNGEVVIISS